MTLVSEDKSSDFHKEEIVFVPLLYTTHLKLFLVFHRVLGELINPRLNSNQDEVKKVSLTLKLPKAKLNCPLRFLP